MDSVEEELIGYVDDNDIYDLNKFDDNKIKAIVASFKGMDKVVYDHLSSQDMIPPMLLRQACMEINSTSKDFVTMMIVHGRITQTKLVELSLQVDPGELSGKELIEPSVPPMLLRNHQIMLHAITDAMVYFSTLSNSSLSKRALSTYFPNHDFYIVPAKVGRILEYLDKVEKYGKQQGTLLEVIIRKGVREKVSDIHIYASRDGYNIKTRFLGQLYVERVGGLDEYLQIITKGKIEAGMDPSDKRTPQDGQFDIDYNGRRIDLRVATCPVVGNKETMVIRILDPENSQVHFNDLGITRGSEVVKALRSPNGVMLICGVTGSGKTTTATSAIRWILDRFSQAVNTIEDPVENELSDTKQTQIDPRSGVTFAKVLRSILRQDPDVVVLGEVRDNETAQIMFQAAETGHLLLGTLHVKDIRGVVRRLMDLGVEREKIIGQLRGVLVQKLIRVSCDICHGVGCDNCDHKGYTARSVVSEAVFLGDSEEVERLMDKSIPRWWPSIVEDAYAKYRGGLTDRKEMVRSFGPIFETYEEKEAERMSELVIKGEFDLEVYKKDFPAHLYLLEQYAV
jgi:general secretion pathway protein E